MGNSTAVSRRTFLWVSGALAALLVAVIIVVVVLLTTIQNQAEHESYQNCLARLGYAGDAPPVLGDRTEDQFIEDMAVAAEYCAS